MNTQKSMRYDQLDYDALMRSAIPASLASNEHMRFDSAEDASVFFARELDYVKARSYDKLYPEFTALELLPASSEINPGAETATYYSYDKTGFAKIISNYATDLPRADVKGKPTTAVIKSLGDSYGYSIQEMRASRMAGKSLDTRKAESARYQIDYLNNKIAWMGDEETGLRGLLSADNDIPLYVPANGAKGTAKWADKTEDEILADITGMMTQMARVTKKVEKPDTIALPSEAYIILQNRRIESTDSNLLSYIQNNIKDITNIVSCPELDPDSTDTNPYAADDGTGKGVMILFKNSPDKLTLENPLPFTQYPVQTEGLEMVVNCEARTAGVMIYYPMSLLIATGIV